MLSPLDLQGKRITAKRKKYDKADRMSIWTLSLKITKRCMTNIWKRKND